MCGWPLPASGARVAREWLRTSMVLRFDALRPLDSLALAIALPALANGCASASSVAEDAAPATLVAMEEPRLAPPAEQAALDVALVSTSDDQRDAPRCSPDMALVSAATGDFCIDRFECSIERHAPSGARRPWPGNLPVDGLEADIVAVSVSGHKPQGYINLLQARVACERAGKRLCTSPEWVTACRGPGQTRYPYGNERTPDVCNDRFTGQASHPVVRLFRQFAAPGADPKSMWTEPWLNDPRLHDLSETVSPAGAFVACTNEFGVTDMVGNLHEWVDDSNGVFRGGFFMDTRLHGEGCEYRTSVHGPKYHDYSTGFRCCADAAEAVSE